MTGQQCSCESVDAVREYRANLTAILHVKLEWLTFMTNYKAHWLGSHAQGIKSFI